MIKLKDMILEGIDPKRHIDRREEAEGISFMKEHIFPKVVDRWNLDNVEHPDYFITERDLIKTFKKVGHHFHDREDRTTTDVINYQATTEKTKLPFEFELYKEVEQNGKLIVAWLIPGEGTYRTSIVFRGLTENINTDSNLSNQDEQRALQFIERRVIPDVVRLWNKNQHPSIGEKDIRKTMTKKMSVSNLILYTAHPVDKSFDRSIHFSISRDTISDNRLSVRYQFGNLQRVEYYVDDKELYEGIERKYINHHINKIEEQQSLDFLRKSVFPIVVRQWNKACKSGGELDCYINELQLIKNLKKINHHIYPDRKMHATDIIEYQSNFQITNTHELSTPFRFEIFKQLGDGKLMVSWALPGGGHYASSFVGDVISEIKINESLKKPYRISKIQEGEALQFMRNRLIPHFVKMWNRFRKEEYQTSYEEVLTHLKKIRDDRPAPEIDNDVDGGYDNIIYACKIPRFRNVSLEDGYFVKFYICHWTAGVIVNYSAHDLSSDIYHIHGDAPKLTEVKQKSKPLLTKLDEESSLSVIIKEILPTMIGNYEQYLETGPGMWNDPNEFPKLTVKKVAQKLKKIKRDDRSVEYFAKISSNVSFYFKMYKSEYVGGSDVILNCTSTFGGRSNTLSFYLGGDGKLNIQEGVQGPSPINKMEEEYVLNFINRQVIPETIDKVYNGFWLKKYPHASDKTYPRIGYQSIRKNLRKIKQSSHIITYESKINDYVSFEFEVSKSSHDNKGTLLYINIAVKFGAGRKHIEYSISALDSNTIELDPPDDYYLPENVETDGPPLITRAEESEAVDYIRKMVIPKDVVTHNVLHHDHSGITNLDVIKNIKKKTESVYHSDINRNRIVYRSEFRKRGYPTIFTFHIEKGPDGNIYVSSQDELSNVPGKRYKVNEISMKTPTLKELLYENARIEPITEIEESAKPLQEVAERLSKEEELAALDYIQKDLISVVLNDEYFHFIAKFPKKYQPGQFPRITTKDINKNLKKIRSSHSTAVYESVISDDVFFQFHIQKLMNKVMIGFNGPIKTEWTWYDFGEKKKANTKESINENFNPNHPECLTKLEEEFGVDCIIKIVIPNQVKFRNEHNQSGIINPNDVIKTLKKINQIKSANAPCINQAVYEASFQEEPYVYAIYKTEDGKVNIRLGGDGTIINLK